MDEPEKVRRKPNRAKPVDTNLRWQVQVPAYLWRLLSGDDKEKYKIVQTFLRARQIVFSNPPGGPPFLFWFRKRAEAETLINEFIKIYTTRVKDPEIVEVKEETQGEYRRQRRNINSRVNAERREQRTTGIRKSRSAKLSRRGRDGRFKSRRAKPRSVRIPE